MELIKFIQNNPLYWVDILRGPPYCLTVVIETDYILIKYNQIESDFKEQIVQEARGIILRKKDLKPVCVPFSKFFNFGEGEAALIDWNTARVEEKLDGSIIKYWFNKYWHVSTNGTIDAFDAEITIPGVTFGALAMETLAATVGDIYDWEKTLDKNYTYMFELCHPLNKIVVRHEKPAVYHIGTRDNTTFKELTVDIGTPKPRQFSFNSLEDVIAMAQVLPYSEEGYVVVDANWNRIKIKSPSYIAVHHLKNNGVITYKRIIELVLKNEQQEFIAYFPEFTPYVKKAVQAWTKFTWGIAEQFLNIKEQEFATRKDYALEANKTLCPAFMFQALDKGWDVDQIISFLRDDVTRNKLVEWLKLKDEKVEKEKIVIDI